GQRFPDSRPVVAAFCALPGEPGGTDLPEALQEAGYEVVLPVVKHSPRRLEWRTFTGMADLVANSMGILEPTGENLGELVDTADVAILPALALGSDGTRLGQGGGFYDRTLAAFVPGDSTLPSETLSHRTSMPPPPHHRLWTPPQHCTSTNASLHLDCRQSGLSSTTPNCEFAFPPPHMISPCRQASRKTGSIISPAHQYNKRSLLYLLRRGFLCCLDSRNS